MGRHRDDVGFNRSLCFILAYRAELIGLADVIGALAAGAMLAPYGTGVRAEEGKAALAEFLHSVAAVFTPLFFVLMGIKADIASLLTRNMLHFGAGSVLAAPIGTLACGLV
jgi:Kef-type K+ transport system membrane component KefB